MPVSTIIRQRRKEKGYTQEQVAEYLGVSAPAVNKWERGASFPDITLLAPLARLLDTDLNTLLCFEKELSEKEIVVLCNKIVEEIRENGFESGYEKAMQIIRQYPSCGALIQMAATTLEGALIMYGTADAYKYRQSYGEKITSLYERAARVGEGEVKNRAAFMLASKYMQKEEYEKAREMLEILPERSAIDKRQVEVQILTCEKRYEEAQIIQERRLLSQVMEVQQILWGMLDVEIKQGNAENANRLSGKSAEFVKLFELWDYNALVAPLEMAFHSKDEEKSIQVLEAMLKAVTKAWDMSDTFLYRHLSEQAQASGEMQDSGQEEKAQRKMKVERHMMQTMISMLEHDESCAFLHGNEKFDRMLERLKELQ